jgi:Tfp pilus assembly protein PilF
MNKYDEALKEIDFCLEKSPKSEQFWVQRANILKARNDIDAAKDAVKHALAINPKFQISKELESVIN